MERERLHLAFTGTRHGMSPEQAEVVSAYLKETLAGRHGMIIAHHGECIGADAQFHHLCRQFSPRIWIVGHPAIVDPSKRAWDLDCDERREEEPPLKRNRIMVAESTSVIATPGQMHETVRSGTWATVRYARRMECVRDLLVVFPSGTSRRER